MGKLLIVDDDKLSGTQLLKRLEKRGYACDFVESGNEAIKLALTGAYDLILLDIMMPEVDGLQVLKKIREKYNNFQLPVIMVTAKGEVEDVVDALGKNANDYLTKPVNLDIACARIDTQISLKSLLAESLKAKQAQTITTLITTLNHEINNPLTIAFGNLAHLQMREKESSTQLQKIENALKRITDIVIKIDKIASGDIEEVEYASTVTMYDLSDKESEDAS